MEPQQSQAPRDKGNGKIKGPEARTISAPANDVAGLYAKLAAIMGETSRVKKTGRNEHFKYDYVTEADLSDHIRPLLAKYGIGLDFSVTEVMDLPNNVTQAKIAITLSDDRASVTTTCYGRGQDKNDKGLYKAITGAVKYWLYKSFLVSTGDDPEVDSEFDKKQEGHRSGQNQEPQVEPDEQAQLRAHYAQYEKDAIHMRTLKTPAEIDNFMTSNADAISANRYRGNYQMLARELKQVFLEAA